MFALWRPRMSSLRSSSFPIYVLKTRSVAAGNRLSRLEKFQTRERGKHTYTCIRASISLSLLSDRRIWSQVRFHVGKWVLFLSSICGYFAPISPAGNSLSTASARLSSTAYSCRKPSFLAVPAVELDTLTDTWCTCCRENTIRKTFVNLCKLYEYIVNNKIILKIS